MAQRDFATTIVSEPVVVLVEVCVSLALISLLSNAYKPRT